MKANELRLGNWLYSGLTEKYFQVSADDILNIDKNKDEGLCTPIPLTEEWLLRFGFVKKDNYFHIEHDYFGGYAYDLRNYCLTKCYPSGINEFHSSDIKHVHQLQNLYFALTGTELELRSES